jgi:hypothetical protein
MSAQGGASGVAVRQAASDVGFDISQPGRITVFDGALQLNGTLLTQGASTEDAAVTDFNLMLRTSAKVGAVHSATGGVLLSCFGDGGVAQVQFPAILLGGALVAFAPTTARSADRSAIVLRAGDGIICTTDEGRCVGSAQEALEALPVSLPSTADGLAIVYAVVQSV